MTKHWHRISGPKALVTRYPKLITAIRYTQYKSSGLDLKRSAGKGRIFGFEVDYTNRLLATTIEYKEKKYLYFLEPIDNHDYQKSAFLKIRGYLKKYISLHWDEIVKDLENSYIDLENDNINDTDLSDTITPEFIPFNYFGQYIELSNAQNEALKTNLPNILCGSAGAGKSCLAFVMLTEYILNLADEDDSYVLYVAEKPDLVNNIRMIRDELSSEYRKDRILVLTYRELLKYLNVIDDNTKFANAESFAACIKDFVKVYKTSHSKSEKFNFDAAAIYDEFRIACGYAENDYIHHIGADNTSYKTSEERQVIWNIYQYYLNYLKKNSLVDVAFYSYKIKDRFNLVVVDEAHDLSTLQQRLCGDLASNRSILYISDTRQQTTGKISHRTFLRKYIHEVTGQNCEPVQLQKSYRCPPLVIDFANCLDLLKRKLVGGAADGFETRKIEYTTKHSKAGSVVWIDTHFSAETQVRFDNICTSSSFAVVTLPDPELVREAQKVFKTKKIFTDIKGLQYDVIIIYKMFDHPIFKEANAELRNAKETKINSHKPKGGIGNAKYAPYFSLLNVAVTRALRSVIIVQDTDHNIDKIKEFMSGTYTTEMTEGLLRERVTQEQWLIDINLLLRCNSIETDEIAKYIYVNNLNATEKEFHDYLIAFRKPIVIETLPPLPLLTPNDEEKPHDELKPTKTDPESSKTDNDNKRPKKRTTKKNAPSEIPVNVFVAALKNDDVTKIASLFENKRLSIDDTIGKYSLFETAVIENAPQTVKYLLYKQHADPNKGLNCSPLLIAISKRYHSIVRILLANERTNPNLKFPGYSCALVLAVQNNDVESIRALCQNDKVDFNIYFNSKMLLINYLMSKPQLYNLLHEILMTESINVCHEVNTFDSSLIIGIFSGNNEAVKLLLSVVKIDVMQALLLQTIPMSNQNFINLAQEQYRSKLKKQFEKKLGAGYQDQWFSATPAHFAILLNQPALLDTLLMYQQYDIKNDVTSFMFLAQALNLENIVNKLREYMRVAMCIKLIVSEPKVAEFYKNFKSGAGLQNIRLRYESLARYTDECTLIEYISFNKKMELLIKIFHDPEIDLNALDGPYPIFWALRSLREPTSEDFRLLLTGANFNPDQIVNATTLLACAVEDENIELTKALLNIKHADPNIQVRGEDPIRVIISLKQVELFKLFYYHPKLKKQNTTLFYITDAVAHGTNDILRLLLQSPSSANEHRLFYTPLEINKACNIIVTDFLLDIPEKTKPLLVDYLTTIFGDAIPDSISAPVMFLAVCYGNVETINLLLTHGAALEFNELPFNASDLAEALNFEHLKKLLSKQTSQFSPN